MAVRIHCMTPGAAAPDLILHPPAVHTPWGHACAQGLSTHLRPGAPACDTPGIGPFPGVHVRGCVSPWHSHRYVHTPTHCRQMDSGTCSHTHRHMDTERCIWTQPCTHTHTRTDPRRHPQIYLYLCRDIWMGMRRQACIDKNKQRITGMYLYIRNP